MNAPKKNPVEAFAEAWCSEHLSLFDNDLNKANAFIKEFCALEKAKKYDELLDFSIKKGKGFEEIVDYIMQMRAIQISFVDEQQEVVADDKVVNLLSAGLEHDSVKKINKPFSYEENVAVCEEVRKMTGKFLFLISNNTTITGKLLGKVRDNKIKIDLVTEYTPKEDPNFWLYFGQGATRVKAAKSLSTEFYSYFFDADSKNYLLLSLEPIKTMRISVSGMVVNVADKMVVGESFQLPSKLTVIFAHHVEEEKRTFSDSEIDFKVGKMSYDELRQMFFGVYHHPIWLEKMILSCLFGGAFEGYPAHLVILGPPKTGKTASIITPIWTAIPDLKQNGQSTFKGLIPSFGGKGIAGFNEGALLRSDRICFLDEFMTPITSGSTNYTELSNQFGKINSILEWNVSDISSGLGKSVSVMRPTMQILACGNYQHGCEDMTQIAVRLNNAGLSRMIWYSQNQENIDFLNDKIAGIMSIPVNDRMPKQDRKAVALFDYFKQPENMSQIDFKWIVKKHKEYAKYVSRELSGVYTRYDHHLACILDGISKIRWLTREKESFRVLDEEDYKQAEEIFSVIISSWKTGEEDLMKYPKWSRIRHLQTKEREVYEHISAYNGINIDELAANFKESITDSLDLLKRWGLVYQFEDKFYCYYTNVVKERQLEATKGGQNRVSQWDETDI